MIQLHTWEAEELERQEQVIGKLVSFLVSEYFHELDAVKFQLNL
jgi:hypothetical protein